ncbi:DNA cytosine methyltransferase [Streptomyces sp. NPDC057623]|uniref:DNA cytosine methyltransferase n=1 Tax=Streptomyces sp. NPDC057623 TaxID=3346187 RepID=UPI0036A7D63F
MATADLLIGSLCSGVGGLDLGVQAALGGRIAWHAETDPHAARVLARHWPHTPNLGDVRTTDWSQTRPVCVLTAGFPCQGLSVAGPRTGLTPGTRSGLWHHIADAIRVLSPCLVVIENVRGLLSTRAGTHALRHVEPCPRCLGDRPDQPRMRALGVLLADLADLGYDANWTCVRASDIGAPHRRDHAFLTAWPARRLSAEDPDLEPGHQRRLSAPCQAQGRRPRPHPGRRGRTPAAHPDSQRRCQGLTEPVPRRRQPHPCLHRGDARRSQCINQRCGGGQDGLAAAHPDLIRRERRSGDNPETPRRPEPPNSCHSPAQWWGAYLPAIRRWEHITAHPAPSPTQPRTRRLSAEFVEWMMGLNGYITAVPGLSRATLLRLLGNAVVPAQAAHALDILLPPRPGCGALSGADVTPGGGR